MSATFLSADGIEANNIVMLAIGFGAALVFFYVAGIVTRAKEEIAFRAKRTAVALGLYLACLELMSSRHYPGPTIMIVSLLVGVSPKYFMRPPKRSRYISAKVRRAVIARDLGHGSLDSERFHLDHIVPFSKGGDHSVKNLRVLDKRRNLKKGAKMPKVRDLL